jgi:hypothetical protein
MEQQVKKPFYKKWWFIALAIFFGIGFIGTLISPTPPAVSEPVVTEPAKSAEPAPVVADTTSKEDAQKEFTRLMDLSKKSGLVKSYEMDKDTPLTIYVSNVWYTQEVQFKKNMLTKFSSLEEDIYGRHRLEVLDAYSNEKLAEVTAFSGSVEIYK